MTFGELKGASCQLQTARMPVVLWKKACAEQTEGDDRRADPGGLARR